MNRKLKPAILNLTEQKISNTPKIIGLIIGPIVFIILNLVPAPEALSLLAWKVISVALWMAIWWVSEAIPIPVTAILPMILFPVLGVFDIETATSSYSNKIIFLFMGGFMIALALEKRNLHKRIALNLIRITGSHPNGIVLGFMIATAFLSMWISNTATTVMMLPIATSVTSLLSREVGDPQDPKFLKFSVSLMLGIAYSANIGGSMTIIGTPPNVVFAGYVNDLLGQTIDFSKWILIGLPIGALLITICYFLLTKIVFPSKLEHFSEMETLLIEKITDLGKITKAEKGVGIVFLLTALFWILRQPINNLLGGNYLNDTIIAMSGGVLMFLVPVNLRKNDFLLDWESMKKLPWGILILFGGGLCLANAMDKTGLVELIGTTIAENNGINLWVLVLILTSIMLFMTEIMSNVALATVFIPVVIGIAKGFGFDPLTLAIPVAFAASFAFMMPISTPPNAIVFSSGHIRMNDMIKAGFLLNIISIITLVVATFTIVKLVF